MRILFLTSRFPLPLDKGDKLRAYHQIAELARHHELVLCALSDRKVDRRDREMLGTLCSHVEVLGFQRSRAWMRAACAVATRLPFQVAYFFEPRLMKRFRDLVARVRPDHIVSQLIRTAEYARRVPVPATLDFMDAFSWGLQQRTTSAPRWMAPLYALEAARVRRYEAQCLDSFQSATVISASDAAHLPPAAAPRVVVAPNGVDLHRFRPPAHSRPDVDLLFVGNMGYPPNVAAAVQLAREILPRVREVRPDTSLAIVGANPSRRVRALAGPLVQVTGWVDDMPGWYARARLFVAPMSFGTGLQNKLLQAMAMGLPCVTTPVANRSLHASPDEARVEESTGGLARACLELLDDAAAAEEMGQRGLQFVRTRFTWAAAVQPLERCLMEARIPSFRTDDEAGAP